MSRFIHFPSFIVFTIIVLVLGWVANATIGLSYWVAVAIIAAAILVNGIVIAFEKDDANDKSDNCN